jgi:aminoglycoside 3-N-acetyltransferase
MRIDKLVFRIKSLLPEGIVFWLRKPLYWGRKLHPKLSKDQVKSILINKLGLRKGSVVYIHSSVDKMYLNFSYFELYAMLKDIVGEDGTLIFPTSQIKTRAEDFFNANPEYIFDVKKTPSIRGMLSEIARRDKKSIRSLHPTNSVVGVGRLANEFIYEQHTDIYPCGIKSPLYKLTQNGGIIIGLGVDTEYLTFVHAVEDVMAEKFPFKTRDDKIFECKVRNYNNEIITVKTLVAHKNIQHRNVPLFIRKYIDKSICDNFKFKGVSFFKADSKKLFAEIENLARKNITVYSV